MIKYLTIPNFLTIDECNSLLIKCKEELVLKNATIRNGELDVKSRKSSVAFISDLGWLNGKLQNTLLENIKVNGFDVTSLGSFQFTEYNKGEFYKWHTDNDNKSNQFDGRYFSCVIQLNDEYSGGKLELRVDDTDITLKSEIGTLYMFSSYLLHRVTEVTSGTRYSLVNWVSLEKNKTYNTSLI